MERSSGKIQRSDKLRGQENDSVGNKEEDKQPPRVTFNAGEITVVRRPGEGSRPLFDRDEILNHERNYEKRRCRHGLFQDDANTGERRRGYDSQRIRSFYREGFGRERCGTRCPTCRRYSTYFSDDEDMHASHYGDRLFRTRSDERMFRDHSYLYHDHCPYELYYYHFEDPAYYEVVGNLILPPSFGYSYFTNCEY